MRRACQELSSGNLEDQRPRAGAVEVRGRASRSGAHCRGLLMRKQASCERRTMRSEFVRSDRLEHRRLRSRLRPAKQEPALSVAAWCSESGSRSVRRASTCLAPRPITPGAGLRRNSSVWSPKKGVSSSQGRYRPRLLEYLAQVLGGQGHLTSRAVSSTSDRNAVRERTCPGSGVQKGVRGYRAWLSVFGRRARIAVDKPRACSRIGARSRSCRMMRARTA